MRRTILISGCSSGIGRATAILFQETGWNVSATMRSPEMESQMKTLDRVRVLRMDVTEPVSIEHAIRDTVETFGDLDTVLAFWDKPERRNGRATDRDVAETTYRAATDGTRQIRYMVGEDARALWDTRWKLADQGFVESIRKEALGED